MPPSTRPTDIAAIFRPRSVAVIGASRKPGSIGAAIFQNLLSRGFTGPVYPVNPHADSVAAVKTYPTIEDVPGDVDLAVIVIPAPFVIDAIEACGRKGVRAAVVITAGFKEVGDEGRKREDSLLASARRHGIRLIGPNCMGVLNTEADVSLDATFAPVWPPAGHVAFSTQSGALGLSILQLASHLHVGISQFASVGNKADVSGNDLLEFWETDPNTHIILLYLESFGTPQRFIESARRITRKKPIIAVKSGRSAAGARAASSHTGSLAGPDAAVDALCRQSGVIRVNTMEELFDVAMLLAHQPVPAGNRVGVITNAGGPAIMASDALEGQGLVVPDLTPETEAALHAFLPAEASTRNPVDMIASASPEAFERAVELVSADPNVDSVLAIYVPPIVTHPVDIAQAIVRGAMAAARRAETTGEKAKPVASCFLGSHGVPEGLRTEAECNIPSYSFPEAAAISLSHAVEYGEWLETTPGEVPTFEDIDPKRASDIIQSALDTTTGRAWLTPDRVHELLTVYGIPLVEEGTAKTADEAASIARRLGFPVAVKLVSDSITHKSDVRGVRLNVQDEQSVRDAFAGIESRLRELGRLDDMQGVSVQRMVKQGVEAIVGVTRDSSFGPIVMFGLGGVYVEVLQDVAFRVPPLTDQDARNLVREVRGYPLLEGYRGAAPGDVLAIENTLLRVSQLVRNHPEIAEMDLNPIKVLEPGQGCVAVDARIAVEPVRAPAGASA